MNKVQQMMQGKSDAQMRDMVQNIAKERGIDLNQLAGQLGIRI